jgi:hypothetical protein
MNKLLLFISKAAPPLWIALAVAGLARQSGLADTYVVTVTVIAAGATHLVLRRLG